MKEYFRYFGWMYITLAVLLVILGIVNVTQSTKASVSNYERKNTVCTTTERVFDYGDVLTDKEEEKLRKLIAKREAQTGCDILLITLEESLEEYARAIEPDVPNNQFVRVYAEQFYENGNFGYDKPNGDGVVLVDNWYRESDGKIYTWFCTTGKAKDAYSDADIDHILDNVYKYVESNPYRAYKTYVNDFYHDMSGTGGFSVYVPDSVKWIVGLVAALVFVLFNWNSKRGKKTTVATTYVKGSTPQFREKQDIFLRKSVTKHKIESSSSGGGGSHGGGGGGGSHGGGGHSR